MINKSQTRKYFLYLCEVVGVFPLGRSLQIGVRNTAVPLLLLTALGCLGQTTFFNLSIDARACSKVGKFSVMFFIFLWATTLLYVLVRFRTAKCSEAHDQGNV